MKRLFLILALASVLLLAGCTSESADRDSFQRSGVDMDKGASSGQYDPGQESSAGMQQMDEKCNEYTSGVASTFELYTECVDNDLTEAMRSGEPHYCKVSMDTQYMPLESSTYDFWVLGNKVKYKLTLVYPDGEVQEGTYILTPEGTYASRSNTLYGESGTGKGWDFISSSESLPYYNVAGLIEPPSTITCEKQEFGEEMFDT